MKIPTTVKTAGIFAAGLLLGAVIFFPWNSVADYAAASAVYAAGSKGIGLEIKETSSEGILAPKFIFSGVKASTPMAHASISHIEVDPVQFSLTGDEKRFSVYGGSGSVQGQIGGGVTWRSARSDVTLKNSSILIENISVDGDIKGKGAAELSSSGKLMHADLTFTLPDKLNTVAEALAVIGSLPLKKDPAGGWRLKK